MELTILSFVVNGLMGIAMYFMKQSRDNDKQDMQNLKAEVNTIRDTYYKKEDFREFKQELWERLDSKFKDLEQRYLEHQRGK